MSRRRTQDSGIGIDDSLDHDDVLPHFDPTIEEDDDEEGHIDINPPLQPVPHPIMAAAPVVVSGSQINQLPEFDGAEDKDIDIWISHIERCQGQFNWSDMVTCASAKGRMKDKAAYWLHSQKLSGNDFIDWKEFEGTDAVIADPAAVPPRVAAAQVPARPGLSLKDNLKIRFKLTVTALAAADAVTNLNQRKSECVNGFYDRVIVAVDKKNFSYSEAQKADQEYRNRFMIDVFVFFHAGLTGRIKGRATGGTSPPTTAADLLKAAMEAEAYFKRADLRAEAVNEVDDVNFVRFHQPTRWGKFVKDAKDVSKPQNSSQPRGKGQGKGQGQKKGVKCYECEGFGHIGNECPTRTKRLGGKPPSKPNQRKDVKVYEVNEETSENEEGSFQ